jgi:ABC-type spermidine/putrescine transport system permease subunit I
MTAGVAPIGEARDEQRLEAVRAAGRGSTQYAGFIPALILFGGFLLVPLGIVVCYSFWTVVNYNVVHDWTLGNYRYFLGSTTYVNVAWATLWVSLATTVIDIALALPLAYWLVRYVSPSLRNVLLVLAIIPFWTSYLLRVYAWLSILGQGGAINRFLIDAGLTHGPTSLFLYNRSGVILVLVYLYFPFALLSLYVALERMDWQLVRAALDLGAPPWKAFVRIVLPQIKSGIVTAFIFVFVPVLGEYLTPQIVGGVQGVMLGNTVVNFFQLAEYTQGAAAALIIAAVALVVLFVMQRWLDVGSYERF